MSFHIIAVYLTLTSNTILIVMRVCDYYSSLKTKKTNTGSCIMLHSTIQCHFRSLVIISFANKVVLMEISLEHFNTKISFSAPLIF